ncbi:L-proline dehydrogenase /delta-1-pyrroline-5-carboxylate dehydrogenase [Mitsuaria sp. PDC51]|uniref:L-glutamate gamma-semialdehyde dehydrogenase n=1 Tax=Mitsuaria sp. PDC51 TaxID=1881035 RepID=UPI0008E9A2CA|nr:L-proline dehydrogenase /delta-1-pyrroline-5-carboxylate dehydrogenase [Mitsuaria sp. PDC51]
MTAFALPPETSRLPDPYREELPLVRALAAPLQTLHWPAVVDQARPWVQQVRANPAPFWAMESLLREYPITSAEGLALMRLAEALLRVPDAETAIALTADQLGRADFEGGSDGPHKMLAGLAASAISLSKKFLPDAESDGGLMKRLGAQTVVAATVRAIQLLGRQFVLGRNIQEAMKEADAARKAQAQLRFSYDMLGEGARTERDAERYQASYLNAIAAIAAGRKAESPEGSDGISIKLSALFSRYEVLQRERVYAELLPRVWQLVEKAAQANINLTIDAEEVDRLELSLELLDALAARIATHFPQWRGFGLAVQAYQTRARDVVEAVAAIARRHGLRFMVRLVKGAYWDGEIKRAQEQGLPCYPVYTHKPHTDVSYLACAQALLQHHDVIYPQFASHNAGTIAAILQMARALGAKFEMQRLHGMGEGIYREVLKDGSIPCRVYAPVGEHRDLLAYLVRRLLENGANSSFVHQLADPTVAPEELLASPMTQIQEAVALPLPVALYRDAAGRGRDNSAGLDLAVPAQRQPLLDALAACSVPTLTEASPDEVDAVMARLQGGFAGWNATPVAERAAVLRRAADALQAQLPQYCALLVKEAYKSFGDAISEVREAIDFLRYYADEAERLAADGVALNGRGVFVCISPWNFPLAIFAGQVVAALAAGNAVAAKPAEQTPAVAAECVKLLHAAGVPEDAVQLVHGRGETVGARLVAAPQTAGVCFTGSTQVAQIINRQLAAKPGAAALPLIAETGGLNAMIVDSTALPEQVIDAVVQSAFRSAGQRCSALRLLAVHEAVADGVIEMLRGAVKELRVGDSADLATDVGPLIDDEAFQGVSREVQRLKREATLIAEAVPADACPRLLPPVAVELPTIASLKQEIFGPVLHVVRWSGDVDGVVREINALGYGLTLGIQTRIDSRALRLASQARIGNVYVNRNIIGAVVGVQPFGGEGMSGTGPKAGGPHYLLRFAAQPKVEATEAAAPALVTTVAGADLGPLFAAHEAWAERALDERATALERASAGQPPVVAGAWRTLGAAARRALVDVKLPGPTGESNELRLHGRGVIAVLAQGASTEELARALGAALVAGNAVAVVGGGDTAQDLRTALMRGGVAAAAMQLLPADQLGAVLRAAKLAGVIAPAGLQLAAQRELAGRDGAILPVVPMMELADARQLYRLVAEQTLTINTAAAGGNAALLAGVH